MIQIINTLGEKLPYKTINFSDGTRNIVIDMDAYANLTRTEIITLSVASFDANEATLFELLMVVDALRDMTVRKFSKVDILFNYLPHARADRRFENGAAFPLEIFFNTLLKMFPYIIGTIYIIDAHAPAVVDKLIDNFNQNSSGSRVKVEHIKAKNQINHFVPAGSVVVFPDAGAAERYGKYWVEYATATKVRNPQNGHIESFEVSDMAKKQVAGKVAVILDDICDGGGTFIPLAKVLGPHTKELHLVVTHGIFSKGLKPFEGYFKKIHCANHVGNFVSPDDIIRFNETGVGVEVKK